MACDYDFVEVDDGGSIYPSTGGRLFKVLYRPSCTFDCMYCITRCSSRSYTPSKLASTFLHLHRSGQVKGLFLSSGISPSPDQVAEEMLQAVQIIRSCGFDGYIHFKILPGVSRGVVERAARLADRLSINVEAPTPDLLSAISPSKDMLSDIIRRQRWIRALEGHLPSGQTTQMILGIEETDREALKMAEWEYREMGLRRVYYSPFRPVPGSGLPERSPPRWRTLRIYQTDALIRIYRWPLDMLDPAFDDEGYLKNEDPKSIIAPHILDTPIDPHEAEYQELLMIPGIGPRRAREIMEIRSSRTIDRRVLRSIGIPEKSMSFMKIDGWRQTRWEEW